jgi:hypothetical protein
LSAYNELDDALGCAPAAGETLADAFTGKKRPQGAGRFAGQEGRKYPRSLESSVKFRQKCLEDVTAFGARVRGVRLHRLVGVIEMHPSFSILKDRIGISERNFIWIGVALIVISRIIIIVLTPRFENHNDIAIYQQTGKLALFGINPYDFQDHPQIREQLRTRYSKVNPYISETQSRWDYYVSGNLPGSTVLYELFELSSGGSRLIWRILFIIGDISLFCSVVYLFHVVQGQITALRDQIAVLSLGGFYPSLIVWGTIIPEDKQFETALLIFALGLLLSQSKINAVRDTVCGFVVSLAVLFKFMGVFLLPVCLQRITRTSLGSMLWISVGGLPPLLLSFAIFGTYFVRTMGSRAESNAYGVPIHDSPWVIFSGLDIQTIYNLKVVVAALFAIYLVAIFLLRRIDLANLCSGLMIDFACLWLIAGDISRMNIAMMFASASVMTLSLWHFRTIVVLNMLTASIVCPIGLFLWPIKSPSVGALLTIAFLVSYITVLSFDGARNLPLELGGPKSG